MKKSLIALAVLAASGASFAQSTVTLYGLADVWVGSVKSVVGATTAPAVAAVPAVGAVPAVAAVAAGKNFFGVSGTAGSSLTTTKLDSGGVNTSRWGLKGSEDLGGGLKASFQLEQGFNLDDGSVKLSGQPAGQAFSRQSWVGVSGGFGAVQLGKSWSAFDDVSGASNAVFDSALAPMNHVFRSIGYNDRPANGLKYISPTFGGFAGAVSYSLDEKDVLLTKVSAINLTYGAGPVAAQFGYQVEDGTTGNDTKFTRLGGSYNFGMATAKLTYGKVTNVRNTAGTDTTEYQIGADFPVGPALTVSASYAKSDDNATLGNQSRKGYGIGAAYTLSKRTFLYGGYTANTASNAGANDDKLDILAVGVQHKF